MSQKFDLYRELKYPTPVSVSRIRLKDKRTDEIHEMCVTHLGETYPAKRLQYICDTFGYGLISCETEDTRSDYIDWSALYEDMDDGTSHESDTALQRL